MSTGDATSAWLRESFRSGFGLPCKSPYAFSFLFPATMLHRVESNFGLSATLLHRVALMPSQCNIVASLSFPSQHGYSMLRLLDHPLTSFVSFRNGLDSLRDLASPNFGSGPSSGNVVYRADLPIDCPVCCLPFSLSSIRNHVNGRSKSGRTPAVPPVSQVSFLYYSLSLQTATLLHLGPPSATMLHRCWAFSGPPSLRSSLFSTNFFFFSPS